MKSFWLTWCMKKCGALSFKEWTCNYFWLLYDNILEKINFTFPPSPPLCRMYCCYACMQNTLRFQKVLFNLYFKSEP